MRLKHSLFFAVALCSSLFLVWCASLKRVQAQSPIPSLQDPLIYVTNSGIVDSVSVIDLFANQLVGSVPLSSGAGCSSYFAAANVAVTPDGVAAYVTLDNSFGCGGNYLGTVQGVNTKTDQLFPSAIPVGNNPGAIAGSPDGKRLYVVNSSDSTVSVIDRSSGDAAASVIATVPVCGSPAAIAVTPNSSFVYVACQSGSTSVISAATNAVVASIEVGGVSIAISLDGTTAYIGNLPQGTGLVNVVNVATNQMVGSGISLTNGNGVGALAVSPGSSIVYALTGESVGNGLDFINTSNNSVAFDSTDVLLSGSYFLRGLGAEPNGSHVAVSVSSASSVVVGQYSSVNQPFASAVTIANPVGSNYLTSPGALAFTPVSLSLA